MLEREKGEQVWHHVADERAQTRSEGERAQGGAGHARLHLGRQVGWRCWAKGNKLGRMRVKEKGRGEQARWQPRPKARIQVWKKIGLGWF